MGRSVLAWLILTEILLVQAMAVRSDSSDLSTEAIGKENREAVPPASSAAEAPSDESRAAEAPEIRRLGKHHSSDKSVAGGGVIVGGLVTAIFAAIYCYIRVTRGRDGDKR